MNPDKDKLNLLGWTCPRPLQNYPTIVMGHGAGGDMMADLIEHLFAPAFDNEWLGQMGDSTVIELSAFNLSQALHGAGQPVPGASRAVGLHNQLVRGQPLVLPGREYRGAGRVWHGQ